MLHDYARQVLALPLPALQSGARLVLQRAYTRLSYSSPYAATASATRLLSSGSLGATVAATDDGQMAVWVIDTETNAPAEGASVRVWGLERTWQLTARGVKQVASGITDADGLVLLTPSYRSAGGLYSAYAVSVGASGAGSSSTEMGAELGGEILLLSDVPRPRLAPVAAPIVRLVSDRSYYRPGEEVHVKGYATHAARTPDSSVCYSRIRPLPGTGGCGCRQMAPPRSPCPTPTRSPRRRAPQLRAPSSSAFRSRGRGVAVPSRLRWSQQS